MYLRLSTFCLLLLLAVPTVHAQTPTTHVMVRAIAHDAKIIGSGVGGARIVIQDAATGAVLAEGVQEGKTGDTQRIMVEPQERGRSLYDTEGAAGFLAELALDRPTQVDITAYGPLGTPHAMQRSAKRMLLVPGQDVLGDGVVLVLNGFTVELELPATEVPAAAGRPLDVQARVTMLCGCPTEPGGLWDADRIDVVARLVNADGTVAAESPLAFTGKQSTFGTQIAPPAPGAYTLQVIAMEPARANFGMAERTIVARP